jgi:hypothetical protein
MNCPSSASPMTPRQKAKFPAYVKRERQPGEALPQIASRKYVKYKPDAGTVRRGVLDGSRY